MAGPRISDVNSLLAAGINPATGLPTRLALPKYKEEFKKFLRIIDEQDACNRYVWYNLPCDLTSQELERLLYYKGQLAFFFEENTGKFYFMPYALDGTIDFYGRFNTIRPVPMTSGTDGKKDAGSQVSLLSQLKLEVVYGIVDEETDPTNKCVLLHDYTKQLSQTIIPRQQINDVILDIESEIMPMLRTALLIGTGVKGMRVMDADQQQNVDNAVDSMYNAVLQGKAWIPVVGATEFQELGDGAVSKCEEYMMSMQSLDNLRLAGYGLENGGLFEKKAHMLNAENEVNQSNVGLVLNDGLSIRQNFCNMCNMLFGTSMWCEPSQNEIMQDIDGDGKMYDSNEGESTGIDSSESEVTNNDTNV